MSKSLKALLGGVKPADLPQDHSSLIPSGEYTTTINKVEVKTSRTGNVYLSVWHRLSGNEHFDNQMLFDNINLGHPDPQVQHQAYGTLSSLLASAGMISGDSDTLDEMVGALPGCNSRIYVTRRDGQNGYGPSNNVSRYVVPAPAAA